MDGKNVPTITLSDHLTIKWTHGGDEFCLHVVADGTAESPVADDPVVKLACWHDRYCLGNVETRGMNFRDFWMSVAEDLDVDADMGDPGKTINELLEQFDGDVLILPLWLHDHSGLSISAGYGAKAGHDMWDTSWLGWAYVAKRDVLANSPGAYLKEKGWKAIAEEQIGAVVDCYDDYLSGNCYGFLLLKKVHGHWVEQDGAYGYVGHDLEGTGMLDQAGNGLREALCAGTYEVGTVKRKYYWEY